MYGNVTEMSGDKNKYCHVAYFLTYTYPSFLSKRKKLGHYVFIYSPKSSSRRRRNRHRRDFLLVSTEPGGVESDSNADLSANASRFEYGMAHTSETLTDPVSFQAQDLVVTLTGIKRKGCVSAHGDNLCNVVDSDDIGEKNRKQGSKLENLDSVILAGSDLLKSKDKNGFANENLKLFESDLVWAKVRSYPWWPGQVFDSSVASKLAMKNFKKGKGNLLVAYFGDSTFTWNYASQIKPFHQHFSQMQKQSNSPEFRDAIDCVLEEVSRRVEFGLSCPCISEKAYNKLKTQNIISPGIREDSRLSYGGDKLSDAMSFKPENLVAYMKHLACFPRYDATEKLQFVINRAQLLAFQQWKGYSHFLEYETFLRSVESTVPKASFLEPTTDVEMSSKKRKTGNNDNDEHKQRFDLEDRSRTDEKTQEKTLSDFNAKKRFGSRSTEKLDGKSHADKKRKVESSELDMSEKKIKNNRQKEDSVSKISDEENNMSVGDANKLQKAAGLCYGTGVANEMNSLTSTLEPCSDSISATKVEVENQETKHAELAQKRISSPDEMLLSLHSDKTPKGILESISIDPLNYEDFEKFINELSCSDLNDDSKKTSITKTSEPCDVKDSAEEQILPANKEITGYGVKEQTALNYCSADSSAPNALILKFAVSGSLPSEDKLNEIFNRYGPLRESETRVMKKSKRAKVVFIRSEDAETAFSSAGKYSIFGPSLLSYGLKYVCPKAQESKNMTC